MTPQQQLYSGLVPPPRTIPFLHGNGLARQRRLPSGRADVGTGQTSGQTSDNWTDKVKTMPRCMQAMLPITCGGIKRIQRAEKLARFYCLKYNIQYTSVMKCCTWYLLHLCELVEKVTSFLSHVSFVLPSLCPLFSFVVPVRNHKLS